MSEQLSIRRSDGVQIWEMGFGAVNAIDPVFLDALDGARRAAAADDSVAVVVLRSSLKVFSAGADAKWMAGIVKEKGAPALLEEFNTTMDSFRELCAAMRRTPILFVAAIGGHALAGGLELAAACDLRFAADDDAIRIGAPEMDLFGAMPSGGGGAQFLARLMGPSRALRFILEAKPLSPHAAYAAGIIDELVDAASLIERTEQFASETARKAGRIGVAAAKRAILTGAELPLGEALDFDRSIHWDAMRRGNFLAGVNAFVERFG